MTAVITIDPSVRVRDDQTCAKFEAVVGPMVVGQPAMVLDPQSGRVGDGEITEVDHDAGVVYLSVDWDSLHDPLVNPDAPDAEPEPSGWGPIGPGGFRLTDKDKDKTGPPKQKATHLADPAFPEATTPKG
jgi:hypothetical protein